VPGHVWHRLVCARHLRGRDLYLAFCLPPVPFFGDFRQAVPLPRTIGGPDVSVLLHLPEKVLGHFPQPCCRGILNGPYGPTCACASFSAPSLEFPKQGFRRCSLFSV